MLVVQSQERKCRQEIHISESLTVTVKLNGELWRLEIVVWIFQSGLYLPHMSSSIQKPCILGWTTRPILLISTTEWNLEQNIWCWRKPEAVCKVETSVVSSGAPLFKLLKATQYCGLHRNPFRKGSFIFKWAWLCAFLWHTMMLWSGKISWICCDRIGCGVWNCIMK